MRGGVYASKSLETISLTPLLSSPPAEFFDAEESEIDLNFGGLRGRGVKKQDPPIERDLYLSLEDLFFGCTKKIKISRRVSTWLAPTGSYYLALPQSYKQPPPCPHRRLQIWSLMES